MAERKLAWVSPLPPAHTDIAAYSARLFGSGDHSNVTLIHTEQTSLPSIGSCRVEPLSRLPQLMAREAHLPVYHIGNNADFHGPIVEAARLYPGLVVAHDFQLQDLFLGLYRRRTDWFESYQAAMDLHYGEDGREAALAVDTGFTRHGEIGQRYPLIEEVCLNALGVVTHNPLLTEEIRERTGLPTACLALPYPCDQTLGEERQPYMGGPFQLLIFGYIGTNRGLREVFAAMARNPRLHLDIAGKVTDEIALDAMLREYAIAERVRHRGFLSDLELNEAIASAHLVVNLRNPTMGEASGSQLRVWSVGAPSVVSNHGWYGTLPEGTVFKIAPDNATSGLLALVDEIIANPDRALGTGRAGKEALRQDHDPAAYLRAFHELAESMGSLTAPWFGYALTRRNAARNGLKEAGVLNQRLTDLACSLTGLR